jgi:hypothetical protein
MAKRDKSPNRCVVCADLPINRDEIYNSGSSYIDDFGVKTFYCTSCLYVPETYATYKAQRDLHEKNFPKTRAYGELPNWQKGPLGFAPLAIIVVLFLWLLFYSISNYEPELNNPTPVTNGEQQEWDADNSIDGPAGAFDDQSKP